MPQYTAPIGIANSGTNHRLTCATRTTIGDSAMSAGVMCSENTTLR